MLSGLSFRSFVLVFMALAAAVASAAKPVMVSSFEKPPKGASKALRIARGKPFESGLVFVDGMYLPPPYQVERYGTVIRINGVQVSEQIVPWDDFVRTQANVSETKSEIPAEDVEKVIEEEVEVEEEVEGDPLDDLFGDTKKPTRKVKKIVKKTVKVPGKPRTVVNYSFDGKFELNDRAKALLAKVNASRTDIETRLRSGHYFFFGTRYSRVTGDAGASSLIVENLPDILKAAQNPRQLGSLARQKCALSLPDALYEDLYRNRYCYPVLAERRKSARKDEQWNSILRNR